MNENTIKLIESVLDAVIQESRLGKYYKHYEDRFKEIEDKYKDLEDKERKKIDYFKILCKQFWMHFSYPITFNFANLVSKTLCP